MIGVLFLIVTGAGLLTLFVYGGGPERWAVGAILLALGLAPIAEQFQYQNIRVGVALEELALFAVFWLLAERHSRAWATAAAGFQLISVLSFVPAALGSTSFVFSGVALRYGAWGLIILTLFGGALECWAERRLRQEANDETGLPRDIPTLAKPQR